MNYLVTFSGYKQGYSRRLTKEVEVCETALTLIGEMPSLDALINHLEQKYKMSAVEVTAVKKKEIINHD